MARDWFSPVNCVGVRLAKMFCCRLLKGLELVGARTQPLRAGLIFVAATRLCWEGGGFIGTSSVPGQECTSPHQGDKSNPQLPIAVKPRLPISMLKWFDSMHPQLACCLTELCRLLVKPHARRNGCPSDAVKLALVYLAGEPFFGFIISHSFSDSILPKAVNSPAPWSHSPPSMVIVSPLM